MPRAAGVARVSSRRCPNRPTNPPPDAGTRKASFSCTGCGNCCKSHGEYSHVYLREEEAKAIAEHLDMELGDFAAAHLQIQDGWLLLRQGDTQCPFLGEDARCGIYEVRPVQCRTWPFWTINLEQRTWREEVTPVCPGSRDGRLHDADTIERIANATEDWYEDRLEQWPGAPLEPGGPAPPPEGAPPPAARDRLRAGQLPVNRGRRFSAKAARASSRSVVGSTLS